MNQILLYCLIPIGMFMLYRGIVFMIKTYSGKILLEMPVTQKNDSFYISEPGIYAIWMKAPLFRRIPVEQFLPVIYKENLNNPEYLERSFFRPRTNFGAKSRMEMFKFSVDTGKYKLELTQGSSVGSLETGVAKLFGNLLVDLQNTTIQIRESQSTRQIIFGLLLTIFGFLFIMAGFLLGAVADQIAR
ncbi:MAG: hypothetical protein WCR52_21725 [Bacteroidota bacterium]